MDNNEDEIKRQKKREAVQKCREKAKQKAAERVQRVEKLKQENDELEARRKELTNQLGFLKDMCKSYASGSNNQNISWQKSHLYRIDIFLYKECK